MSVSTTDELIELILGGGAPAGAPAAAPAFELDAIASEGQVRADEWQLTPTRMDQDSRLDHTFGAGPRVSLRTLRGDIVIKKIKSPT
jgi:hypothetical protein